MFKYAKFLKTKYSCYGHFYKLKVESNLYRARSVLEIIDFKYFSKLDLKALSIKVPDLTVIMMNPGSSKPLESVNLKTYDLKKELIINKDLVLTRPDNTQYQIMRIMYEKNYKHIRVINVCDLIETKSTNLVKLLAGINLNTSSIFSSYRAQELSLYLKNIDTVLLAWGAVKGLEKYYINALNLLESKNKIGVLIKPHYYAHASPLMQTKKESWLNYILNNIKTVTKKV